MELSKLINKESYLYSYYFVKEIILMLLILLAITFNYKKKVRILKYIKIILIISLIIIIIFFRNNLKLKRMDKEVLISPCSSKVVNIKREDGKYKILTWLSPLDRHFMIAPTDCEVIKIEKLLHKGDAERTRVTFKDKKGYKFTLDQIVKKPMSGYGVFGGWIPKVFYKNRIITTCKVGDKLKRGERWGLIRFGSNMYYRLPESYKINIEENKRYSLGERIGEM
jgi:phosphatidylserine decarboxylase